MERLGGVAPGPGGGARGESGGVERGGDTAPPSGSGPGRGGDPLAGTMARLGGVVRTAPQFFFLLPFAQGVYGGEQT
ncbi:hypothetical protein ACP70R_035179 [Stipagrostis hirtigluma subsp. patula]